MLFGYNLSVKGYYYKKIQHLVEKFIFVDLGIMLKFGAPGQTGTTTDKIKISRLNGSMPQTNLVCKIIMIPAHKMQPLTKNNSIQQYFSFDVDVNIQMLKLPKENLLLSNQS